MLSKEEIAPNKAIFRAYSAINLLPFKFDSATGQATPVTSLRLLSWRLNFLLLILFTAFVNVRLVQVFLVPEYFNPIHFPIHFVIATFLTVTVWFDFVLFVASPATTAKIYNEIIRHLHEGRPAKV